MRAFVLYVMLMSTPALAQPDYDANEYICAGTAKFVMNHTSEWRQIKNPKYFYEDSKSTCAAYLADYDDGEDVDSILADIDSTSLADSTAKVMVRKIMDKALKMKMVLQQ